MKSSRRLGAALAGLCGLLGACSDNGMTSSGAVPAGAPSPPLGGQGMAAAPAAGMQAAGMSAAGMQAAGMQAAGMQAAGMSAAGMQAGEMPAAGMSAAGGAAPSAGTGGTPVGGASGGTKGAPTFTAIYDEIIVNKCSGPICHSSPTGGMLVMTNKADAYKALVSAPAQGTTLPGICLGMPSNCKDSGTMRVVPNNPDESLLVDKISNAQPKCGCRMPTSPPPLEEAAIQQIRTWIMKGAPND